MAFVKEVVRGEKLEIQGLPQEIIQPIKETNQRIRARLESCPPRVVLRLQRSAVLPSLSIRRFIKTRYPEVTIEELAVGKVLPYMFVEDQMRKGLDIEEDVDLRDSDMANEFLTWLEDSDDPALRELKEKIRALQLRGKRILVLDDAKSSGETLEITLPYLMKAVYGESIPFDWEVFFPPHFCWERVLVRNLGATLNPAEERLMEDFLKGGIDRRRLRIECESGFYDGLLSSEDREKMLKVVEQNEAIFPLDSEESLMIAGIQALFLARTLDSFRTHTTNPGKSLLERFGWNQLLEIRESVEQKFTDISV